MDDRRTPDRRPRKPTGKPGSKPPFRPGSERPISRVSKPSAALTAPAEGGPDIRAGERIAKVIARAGLCSRRDAEAWINAGRVEVNGAKLSSPAFNVLPDDKILVDGNPLGDRERTRLWLFHKPRGLVTTSHDPEGRPTIFDALPEDLPRVVSIGRLDINTEGLLLLTNDGGLARVLELPATGWLRRYRVRANGETNQAVLDTLRDGVEIDGVHYAGIEAHMDRAQGSNVWLTMGLREGKNREVKRVLEHIGLQVNRLIRLSFGPFQLGELEEGGVEEVRTRILQDQLGPVLAAEAGVDFEGPVTAAIVTREVAYEKRQARLSKPAPKGRFARVDEAEAEPRRETPKPGKRKHVSTLRGARDADRTTGPRVRLERSATADRNGRTVAVERVVVSGRALETGKIQIARGRPKPGVTQDAPPASRNARRFADERQDARQDARQGPASERPAGRREDRGAGRQERPDRPRFEKTRFGTSPRGETQGYPANRSEGGRSAGGRPSSGFADTDRPRPARGRSGASSWQERQAEGGPIRASRGEGRAASRSEGRAGPREDRAAPRAGKPAFAGKVFGKSAGGRPDFRQDGGRSFAGKPSGSKNSDGNSFGGKSFGGKSSGGKSSGGRPPGGKPSGGRPAGPRTGRPR